MGLLLFTGCSAGDAGYDASGVFEATEVIVSSRATGEILALDVTEGARVEAGRALGCIDTVQLHLRRLQILGSLKAADGRRYNVSRQVAALEQQLSTQRGERLRFEKLVRSGAGNQKQLDDVNAQIAVLEKQLAAQRELLENGNESLSGEQLSLEAQLQQVEDRLQKSVITSPISGTVLAKYAEPGELAAEGRALFKVADMERMYLRVYITGEQLTEVKLGQQVRLYADLGSRDRREYAGTITWIADEAEFTPKTIQTREERANLVYAVKVSVANDGYIKRGMYGEIKFEKP